MGLSNEVLCILVAQGAANLPESKVGGTKKTFGTRTEFFQTSNFDLW